MSARLFAGCFPMALFSPQSEKKPSLHTASVGHGVFSAGGVSHRAHQLLLELVGPGRCKEATLKCSMGKHRFDGSRPRFGYRGLSRRWESGVLAPSWSRCHHVHCSSTVKLAPGCPRRKLFSCRKLHICFSLTGNDFYSLNAVFTVKGGS